MSQRRRGSRDDVLHVEGLSITRRMNLETDADAPRLPDDASPRHAFEVTSEQDGRAVLRLTGPPTDALLLIVIVTDGRVRAERLRADGDGWIAEVPYLANGVSATAIVAEFARAEDLERFLARLQGSTATPGPIRERPFDDLQPPIADPPAMAEPPMHDEPTADMMPPDVDMGGARADLEAPPFDIELPPAEMAEPPVAVPEADVPPVPRGAEPEAPDAGPTIAHADAEMPAQLVQAVPFEFTVRLSRVELAPTRGAAHADAEFPVDPARRIEVTILPRGLRQAPRARATKRVLLPAPGAEPVRIVFTLIPVDVGRGEVSVVFSQPPSDAPLATMRLSARVLASGEQPDDGRLSAEAGIGPPPSVLTDLPTIRVDESIAGGRSTLRVAATIRGERAEHTVTIGDKAAMIEAIYQRLAGIRRSIENLTGQERRAKAEFELGRSGASLARTLFGTGVLADLLRRNRTHLSHLVIHTSGELDLPWEIVNLQPALGGGAGDRPVFLGDVGLTRWVYDTARPAEIPIRADRVITVAPRYADVSLQLTRTTDEVAALRSHLGGEPLAAADPRELSARITGGFDLLHFAGHGRWHDRDPRGQQILLDGFRSDADDGSAAYGDADARRDLPERAGTDAAASGPIVFLSACDVGRLQSGTAGLGGFAEAFLRGGAGAFIGCSWAVRDDVASRFVTSFYAAAFTPGTTIGEATFTARRDARRAGDLSALAFSVFADPRTRLVPV